MATQTKAARKPTPQSLSLRDRLAHEHNMAVRKSTATIDILEQEDGVWTDRLIYTGYEYADKFIAAMGAAK